LNSKIFLAVCSVALCQGLVGATDMVRLVQPKSFVVLEEDPLIQGTVAVEGVSQIVADVEPFFLEHGSEKRSFNFSVMRGHFEGRVHLFPGLNLLSLQTVSGGFLCHYVLANPPIPQGASPKNWGRETSIALIQPHNARVPSDRVRVEGVSSDPNLSGVYVLPLTTERLLALSGQEKSGLGSPSQPIRLSLIPVKNHSFSGDVSLEPGTNIFLFRPKTPPASYAQIATKSILCEPSSSVLSLNPPVRTSTGVSITGRLARGAFPTKIQLVVTALVKTEKGLSIRELWKGTTPTDSTGFFSIEIPPPEEQTEEKMMDSPLLSVSYGKERSFRSIPHR